MKNELSKAHANLYYNEDSDRQSVMIESILWENRKTNFEAGYEAALPKWISVKDDLPKEKSLGQSDFVLTFNGDVISINLYDYELKRWTTVLRDSITYWMPLPDAPISTTEA